MIPLQLAILVVVAAAGTAVVLSRDPLRQAVVNGVYGLVLTVTDMPMPFSAKIVFPKIGWSGVFSIAIVFDLISAVLALFVLKPLRKRWLAKRPGEAAASAESAAE